MTLVSSLKQGYDVDCLPCPEMATCSGVHVYCPEGYEPTKTKCVEGSVGSKWPSVYKIGIAFEKNGY